MRIISPHPKGVLALLALMLLLAGAMLTTYHQASVEASATGGSPSTTPRILMAKRWLWRAQFEGEVVALAVGGEEVFTLIDSHGTVIYALNASNGNVLWSYKISPRGRPGGMVVTGQVAYIAVIDNLGNESIIEVYTGSRPPFRLLYRVNFTEPLYRILAAQPLPTGEVAIAGARYRFGRGYQYFVALASSSGVEWSKFWGGRGNEYLDIIDVGSDLSVCTAGTPGWLACMTEAGEALLNTSTSLHPLAILDLGGGRLVAAGTLNSTGYIEALAPGGILWANKTGAYIPTTITALPGGVAVAGVIAPKPYRLGVLVAASNGSLIVFGYSNETYNDIIPLAIAGSLPALFIGGSLGGKPFVESILLIPTTRGQTGAGASGGEASPYAKVILIEEIALAASAAALAVTLIALKPWRRLRRGG